MSNVFMCMGCGVYLDQRPPGSPVLCHPCREQERAAQERRETRARIVGRQPMICGWCAEPFLATRLGHTYCSSTCRWRAWRRSQAAA
jgi:hypothetical protein